MSVSGEQDRTQSNIVMIGVVAELDEEKKRVRVDADGLRTDWIPWLTDRAGPGVRTWWPPEPGEQVAILCAYGDPSQGVVIGSIYQESHDAPAGAKEAHRIEYSDGAFIQYDRAGHTYQLDVPSSGVITLHTGSTTLRLEDGQATLTTELFTVDAAQSNFTGNVSIGGNLNVDGATTLSANVTSGGKNISLTHTHSNSGGSGTGGPVT